MTDKELDNPWVNRNLNNEAEEKAEQEAPFLDADENEGAAEVDEFQAQLNEMRSQVLRAHAEMENVRRRADQDKINTRKFAIEGVVNDLIPILDSLDQALQNAPENDPMAEGVKLTQKMFAEVLSKHGVKEINPVNEKFNPQLHEAMAMQPVPNVEPGTIVAVLQKGYVLNDRLIRPARVLVAKEG